MVSVINNRYRVLQKLAEGGMGTVYLVQDTLRDNQVIALKMINVDLLEERNLTQFKHEFAALSQLHHPNLIEVYDFGGVTDSQAYFFTMEHIAGEDWATLARRQAAKDPNDIRWLYKIVVEVCRGLHYIHSHYLIHYDVKPANVRIMHSSRIVHPSEVTLEGQVKLIDFGLIGQPQSAGQLSVRGTLEYIAPELISGDSVDHRADLYSLGVSLYEIVMGQLPPESLRFARETQMTAITPVPLPNDAQFENGKPVLNVPEAFLALIYKLMSPSPADRYNDANEVIQALNVLSGSTYPLETRAIQQSYIQSGTFIGREFEITRLQGLLMHALQKQGRLVFITGAAGVGKSRLVRELRLQAQMQRVLVCEGLCDEYARSPYRPWVTIFKQLVPQCIAQTITQCIDPLHQQQLRHYVSALVLLMPELTGIAGIESLTEIESNTQMVVPTKADLLATIAEGLVTFDQPLILILEDLQYADAETIELLDVLGQHVLQSSLLLIGVYRNAEVNGVHPLTPLLQQARVIQSPDGYLRRETFKPDQVLRAPHQAEIAPNSVKFPYEILHLPLLEQDAVASLVQSMLGGLSPHGRPPRKQPLREEETPHQPEPLLSWLMNETGGNPRFIESLIQTLLEEDLLYYDAPYSNSAEALQVESIMLSKMPDSIQEAVKRRLARLDPESLHFMQWAAVAGQWIDIDLLSDILDVHDEDLFNAISTATQRHVLAITEHDGALEYRFSNNQIRLALYHTLTAEERAARHARIGEALRARYPEKDILELLAWHFEQAGQFKRALRYAKVAGDKARHSYAHETAVQHYTKALSFVHEGQVQVPPENVYAILWGREETYRTLGKWQAQQADLEEMARIATRMDDVPRQIEVVTHQVELANRLGNHLSARESANSALELARQVGDRKLEADSLDVLGEAHFRLGELDQAYACHTLALYICRELSDRNSEAHNLWHLGVIARMSGKGEEAQEHLKSAQKLFRALGNQQGEADILNELGNQAGDYAQEREYYEQSLALAQVMSDQHRMSRSYNNLALTYWALGLYDRAREYIESAVNIVRELEGRANLAYHLETLGRVYLGLEAYTQAEQVFEEGRVLAQAIGDRSMESVYWYQLGRVKFAQGDVTTAYEFFETACEMQQEMRLLTFLCTSLAWCGTVYLALGNWEMAERYTAEAIISLEEARGTVEYPPQEVWWLHYQVLKAKSVRYNGKQGLLSAEAWDALQQAHITMMEGIATLNDEGLRRNYLNRVQVNHDIITEWTRQMAIRHKTQEIEEDVFFRTDAPFPNGVAVEIERDERAESEQLKDQLRRILDISVRMNETHNPASLLDYVMDQVIELSGAERGVLVLMNEEQKPEFRVAIGMNLEDLAQGNSQGQTSDKISYSVLSSVAQSQQPILLQDALTDERFGTQSSVLELNLRSVLCVPLLSHTVLIGMIYADNRSVSGRFSQADLDLMTIFANQAAAAIDNARLYEDLFEANKQLADWTHTLEDRVAKRTIELEAANAALSHRALQLETSREVSQRATSILGLDTLLAQVVDLIKTQFGYYFVSVWLPADVTGAAADSAAADSAAADSRDRLPDDFHRTWIADSSPSASLLLCAGSGEIGQRLVAQHRTIPIHANSLITSAYRRGEYRLVDRVEHAVDYMAFEELPNIVSEIVLPLKMGEKVLGVLEIASDQPNTFSSDDQLLLSGLADQIAIAIRNAHLYQAEQRRRQLAELLEQTGRALSSSLDLGKIPGLILKELNTLVPYERGLIMLKEENVVTDMQILKPVAHYGFPDAERAQQLAMPIRNGDVFQQLVETRQPLIIPNVMQEPGWKQVPWLPLNHSWLGIPLISQDNVIGMISMTRRDPHAFSPDDVTWVQAFSAQAVIALENARLYAEITRLNEQLEQRVQERTQELNRAYHNLERLDKTKSDFIEVAAHELRTPLTVIKGYTQLLAGYVKKVEPKSHSIFEGILNGTDRLNEIINSMLDVTRIDTQTLRMVTEEVSLYEVIQRVYVGFISVLDNRHLTMTISGITDLPMITGDSDLLYKVFYQLVINAIKYTPDGGHITIKGRKLDEVDADVQRAVSQQTPLKGSIEILIEDTGIGINPSNLELIFEKFYQTGELEFHSSGRTKFKGGGPGLGLAIARGIILAHNGQIWAESEGYDEERCPGSRFYVRLPLKYSPPSDNLMLSTASQGL
ncbi:MAG: GAF domain-containing protein [Anaerolineae bacterium]|nr:GAF domain-containing protein [Anaerolineae bacterium]